MNQLKNIPKFPLIVMLALTFTLGGLYWFKRAIFTETTAEKDKASSNSGRHGSGRGYYRTFYHK